MRLSTPLLSVIMSVYNGEKYIARALLSLLAQTYKKFEIILIDDGSTDSTADIVKSISDERIRFMQQKNKGLTKSLNKALSIANGKWIARHDADDFSIANRFETQIAFLEANPNVHLLGSSCFIQPERHGIINEVYLYPENHNDIVAAFPHYNPFVHGTMIIYSDLLEKNSGYNEDYRYVQDYELWSRLINQVQSYNLATPLYVRTVHQQASQVVVDKEPIFREIRDNYLKRYPGVSMQPASSIKPIQSISFYPAYTLKNNWNRLISYTYFQMSRIAKEKKLPWLYMRIKAFLYHPWSCGTGKL